MRLPKFQPKCVSAFFVNIRRHFAINRPQISPELWHDSEMTESALKSAFLDRVSGYLDGRMDWESVHEASIRLLIENADKFESQPALEELHQIFLADSNDDPQFRESDEEIRRLFALAEKEGPRKLISN